MAKMGNTDLLKKIFRQIRSHIVKIIPEDSPLFRYMTIYGMRIQAKRTHEPLESLVMGVFATDHCNLNCKCCTTFSPIAEPAFLDIETFRADAAKLAELTDGKIKEFYVSGGEPLLHPRLTEIFTIARENFPTSKIFFMTNAILLPKMPESFWKNLKENRIEINISRYPIKIDVEKIRKQVERYGLKWDYVGGQDIPVKLMWKYPFDLEGTQTRKNSYDLCTQINQCVTMQDGVIYPCNAIARIKHFNKYFGTKLELEEGDGLELHKAKNAKEISTFLASPKPFCRYCNRTGITLGIEFGPSKKEITEWSDGKQLTMSNEQWWYRFAIDLKE